MALEQTTCARANKRSLTDPIQPSLLGCGNGSYLSGPVGLNEISGLRDNMLEENPDEAFFLVPNQRVE